MSDGILCTVYRCAREREMYIYVRREDGLEHVPQPLRDRTGELSEVMTLQLHAERKLARVRALDVLQAIADKGYYLQMPPDRQAVQFTLGE